MEPQLSQSHVTLVLSSAYTECAARLPHLSIIRNQLLPHLMVHHPNNLNLHANSDTGTRPYRKKALFMPRQLRPSVCLSVRLSVCPVCLCHLNVPTHHCADVPFARPAAATSADSRGGFPPVIFSSGVIAVSISL